MPDNRHGGSDPASLGAIVDIGKTRSKLVIMTADGRIEYQTAVPSRSLENGPYPHLDTERTWQWLLQAIRDSGLAADILDCVVVTHGAAFALLRQRELAVPVMDYEFDHFESIDAEYDALRDPFEQSLSPRLPAGLNAGRQIYYVQQTLPERFSRATAIVPYPQFWAARLSGVLAAEATSLGSHTDLWRPRSRRYSALAAAMNWDVLMPPRRPAWDVLGTVLPEVADQSGLNRACRIHCGIHDSNASYLRHLPDEDSHVCIISTGTWVVCMAGGAPTECLDRESDMLANVDAYANPVACARFMGGREYEVLTAGLARSADTADTAETSAANLDSALTTMAAQRFALPSFSDAGGPFRGRSGEIFSAVTDTGPGNAAEQRALASLYCALVTDACLDKLGAAGELVVEGRFVRDAVFIEALAQFRKEQPMRVSDDETGTVRGAARLLDWPNELPAKAPRYEALLPASAFKHYRDRWRELVRNDTSR